MIELITSPLINDKDCQQVSCHFNTQLFDERSAGQLGLALPASMTRAVQKRKAEFIAGRYCARAALKLLGAGLDDNTVIGTGANREPLWPDGFVGSVTHTQAYASAMVARTERVRALGLDSELWIDAASVADLSRQILTERDPYPDHKSGAVTPYSAQQHLTLVFSAKESVFKCLFPLVHRFFDFHAAAITPLPESATGGRFRFELLQDLNAEFRTAYSGEGVYAISDEGVHTAVILRKTGLV